jgi:hypothetical protein
MNKYCKEQTKRLNNIKGWFWECVNENNKFTPGKILKISL